MLVPLGRLASAVLFVMAALGQACAADLRWTGAASSAFGDAANWSPATVPGAADRAIFPGDAVRTAVALGGDRALAAIEFTSTAAYALDASGALVLSGALTQSGSGTVLIAGAVRWTVAPSLAGTGSGEVHLAGNVDAGVLRTAKAGAWPLRLSGANVMTGGLSLNGTARALVSANYSIGGDITFGQGNLKNLNRAGLLPFGLHVAVGQALAVANPMRANPGQSALLVADGAGTVLTFNGTWNKSFAGNLELAAMIVQGGAVLRWGPLAEINNNQSDLINARPFSVVGDGLGAVLDSDPDFDADHMSFEGDPLDPTWTNNGVSTLALSNITWRTRATRNLPAVNKKAGGSGLHTKHGLIRFGSNPVRWEVLDTAQTYFGGVLPDGETTIHTERDLTVFGVHDHLASVSFSPVSDNQTVIKSGPATLIIDINQGWRTGSRLRIDQGTVRMTTDPAGGWVGGFPFDYQAVVGSARNLAVTATGILDLRAQQSGFASIALTAGGRLRLAPVTRVRTDALNASAAATVEVGVATTTAGRIDHTGDFTPANLTFALTGTFPASGSFLLATWQGARVGTPAVSGLPAGWALRIDDAAREMRVETAGVAIQTDVAAVTVREGSTATFRVRLSATPAALVTVNVARSGDNDLAVASGALLTFTPGNATVYQTVTLSAAPDGDVANGTAAITCTAAGVASATVTASESDDDVLSVIAEASAVFVPEGGSATLRVRLSHQPATNVALTALRTLGDGDINVTSGALTFTPANFATFQTITLAAAQDADAVNGFTTIACDVPGALPAVVGAREIDDEIVVAIEADAAAVSVPEGGQATFRLRLTQAPAANVQVTTARISGDGDLTVAAGTPLTFTTANFATFQTVTLAAASDTDAANGTAAIACFASAARPAFVTATEADRGAGVNTAPTITAIADQTTTEDVAKTVDFTVADAETAAGSLIVSGTSSNTALVPNASIAFGGNGGNGGNRTVTVTPAANQAGTSTITVTVSDGTASAVEQFALTVTAVDDPPVALAQSLAVVEDTPKAGTLTASDVDGGALAFAVVAQGSKGTVAIGNAVTGAFTYTPNLNATGADSFTFRASAGGTPATVTIAISAVDDPPVAQAQNLAVVEDTPKAGTLGATDVDGGAAPAFSIATQPGKGAVTVNATSGAFTYTPNLNATGADSFTFCASAGGTPATVTIAISAVDDPPVAQAQTLAVVEDTPKAGTLGATDVDGGAAPAFSIATQPGKGAVTVNATSGAFTYTPNLNATGADSFTFRASAGGTPATVTIAISAVDDPPVAQAQTLAVVEDTPKAGTLGATDVDGGAAPAFSIATQPGKGAVTVNATSGAFTYTPNLNATGADSFTFRASAGGTPATVTIAISAVNDRPTITDIPDQVAAVGQARGPLAFTIGDVDTALDALTVSRSSSNQVLLPDANVVLVGSGADRTVTVTPVANQTGSALVTIAVSDGEFTVSDTFTLTVNSNLAVKINFQPAQAAVPPGFLADDGAVFGDRQNGFSYGWNANNAATARDRNAANTAQELDTLQHLQKSENPNASWRIALPNGDYDVTIAAGDPSFFNSRYHLVAEGTVTLLDEVPATGNRNLRATRRVTVVGGELNITSGANANNNKIQFIDIRAVPAAPN